MGTPFMHEAHLVVDLLVQDVVKLLFEGQSVDYGAILV